MNCLAAQLLISIRKRLAGSTKACDGTATVEAAVVLIPFLLLLFGMIEGGLLIWTQSTLQFAVEAAARCGALKACGSTSAVNTYLASQIIGLPVPTSDITQNPTAACGYQVSISYPYSSNGFIVPALFSGTITLTAASCYPLPP